MFIMYHGGHGLLTYGRDMSLSLGNLTRCTCGPMEVWTEVWAEVWTEVWRTKLVETGFSNGR